MSYILILIIGYIIFIYSIRHYSKVFKTVNFSLYPGLDLLIFTFIQGLNIGHEGFETFFDAVYTESKVLTFDFAY